MSSINKVQLIGYLGRDPEVRHSARGDLVSTLSIATSDRWKDKQTGQEHENTQWHRVVLWRRMAEIARDYLYKGCQIYVEGKLTNHKWTDKSGIDRWSSQIEGRLIKMLGRRDEQAVGRAKSQSSNSQNQELPPSLEENVQIPDTPFSDMEDDVPF